MSMIGFGFLVVTVSTNMILQTIVDDDKRGRVMSLYTAAFLGVAPLGSLLAGLCADRIGAATTLLIGGGLCLVTGAVIARELPALRAHMRPIYAKLGINVD
jgi:predicted MFS family arabinose efflux permease